MNTAPHHVFIIRPGGIGKTSSGPLLARKIAYGFVDLDAQFMAKIGHIGNYIVQHGYGTYVRQNSELFFRLLADTSSSGVFALSSGFLIAETEVDVVTKNRIAVKTNGLSIMPLPHADEAICANIVTMRQTQRGLGLHPATEHPKFLMRLEIYTNLADHTVFYDGQPEEAASQMFDKIKNLL